MFKYEFLNKLAMYSLIALAVMLTLTGLWNWIMPVLGIAKLTVWQFTALFVLIHSFTFEIVAFKNTKEKKEES